MADRGRLPTYFLPTPQLKGRSRRLLHPGRSGRVKLPIVKPPASGHATVKTKEKARRKLAQQPNASTSNVPAASVTPDAGVNTTSKPELVLFVTEAEQAWFGVT
jgi:hypothetical protein